TGTRCEMPVARAKQLANMATCAALYAVAIAATAFVPTPWGVGQFRPGVVIPAIYAFIGAPIEAGLGAAIGTFIGSFILQAAGTGLGPLGCGSSKPRRRRPFHAWLSRGAYFSGKVKVSSTEAMTGPIPWILQSASALVSSSRTSNAC